MTQSRHTALVAIPVGLVWFYFVSRGMETSGLLQSANARASARAKQDTLAVSPGPSVIGSVICPIAQPASARAGNRTKKSFDNAIPVMVR